MSFPIFFTKVSFLQYKEKHTCDVCCNFTYNSIGLDTKHQTKWHLQINEPCPFLNFSEPFYGFF